MNFDKIYAEFEKGESDEYYAQLAKGEVLVIPMLVQVMIDNSGSNRRWAVRVLERISGENPYTVYPFFEYIAKIFDKPDRAEAWNSWKIIANILCADFRNLWDTVKEKYFTALQSCLITEFLTVLSVADKIIKAKPADKERIIKIISTVNEREFTVCNEVSPQSKAIALEATENFLKEINRNAS